MRNKTLVRVVTLLLVALMVLTTFAPAFTAYAAEVLIARYDPEIIDVNGTAKGEKFTEGTYKFTFSESETKLSWTKEGEADSDTESNFIIVTSGEGNLWTGTVDGITITEKTEHKWENGSSFEITFETVTTSDDTPILTSAYVDDSRIRRGEAVTLKATIVDTSHLWQEFREGEDSASVYFTPGDFRRGTSNPQNIATASRTADGKIQFDIRMDQLVYTGTGNTIQFYLYYTVGGVPYRYDFSYRVDGCVPYVDSGDDNTDDDDEDVELDPLTPHIIVSQYDYGDAQVSAGNTIDLALTISNTSRHYDLDNIVMKITTGDGFAITSSSNTYYFDSLNVNENITKTISLQASPSAEAQSYPINIEFSFQYIANDKRVSGTSSESISIPVTQLDRFSVNEIQTPTSIYVGDEYEVSVNFVNLGKNVVYNVTAQLEGNMQNSGERSFIGNVASGTEDSADFYITPTQAGTIEGQIVISYEDSNMNVKQVSKPFTIQVEEYPVYDPGFDDLPVIDPVPQEPESPFTLQNILLFLVFAGVTGATGYMTVLRIKAKRSEFDDEDL